MYNFKNTLGNFTIRIKGKKTTLNSLIREERIAAERLAEAEKRISTKKNESEFIFYEAHRSHQTQCKGGCRLIG